MTSAPLEPTAIRSASGSAMWRGPRIGRLDTHIHGLTRQEVHELDAALRHAVDLDPVRIGREQFPLSDLASSLAAIGQQIETGVGFYIIRGLPIERYSLHEAGILLCGLSAYLGRLMPQNAKGELLNHVRDAGSAASIRAEPARGYQNGRALPFHSDSCDIAGLLCICAAKSGGDSAIASSYAIHNVLLDKRPDLLRSLYQPFHIDRHTDGPLAVQPYYSTPVFMWHGGRLFSRFNPGYVYSAQRNLETPRLTEQQMDAMEMFGRLCQSDQLRFDMKLRPGDLQLINNNVLIHSRSAYEDYPEANKKRHLLRVWLVTSGQDENQIPVPMRERYRDMEAWRVNAHIPKPPV